MSIKRTYRVEFSPQVKMCIEGAIKGVYACYGWHDLLDHRHEDYRFMLLDSSSNGYIEALKLYNKRYEYQVKTTKTKLYKDRNINGTELKNEIYRLERKREDEKNRANRALTKAEAKRIRKEKGGLLEVEQELKNLNNIYRAVESDVYEIVHQKMGNGPDRDLYWKPIFDRMYWQFDYISFQIPCWIKERDYCIVNEETTIPEQMITKLERVEPKGSGVNWKSRNRGGKAVVSSRGFDNTATKIYPRNLPNEV